MTNGIRWTLHALAVLAMVLLALANWSRYYEPWHTVTVSLCIQVVLIGAIELSREIWRAYPDGAPFRRVSPDRLFQWEQLQEAWIKIEANTLPGDPLLDAAWAFDEIGLAQNRRVSILQALFIDHDAPPTRVDDWIEALWRYENEENQGLNSRSAFRAEELDRFVMLLTVQRLSRRTGSGAH